MFKKYIFKRLDTPVQIKNEMEIHKRFIIPGWPKVPSATIRILSLTD